jgi:hypothetical protein
MSDLIEQRLKHLLTHFGWTVEGVPFAAKKVFETACGPKLAHLLESRGWVFAYYWSEGRNVLANLSCDGREFDLALVRQLDADITRAIDGTYARGLWLRGVRPDAPVCQLVARARA